MARPIPDERLEEERRKLRFRQMRGFRRDLISELRSELLIVLLFVALMSFVALLWWIKQLMND